MPIQLPIREFGRDYDGYVACARCPGGPAAERISRGRIHCPICKTEQDEREALEGCGRNPPDETTRFIRVPC